MGRPANGRQQPYLPYTVGLTVPYYGTDGDLEPGWVISDGTIQNGFQTVAYPDNATPTAWTGNSNNVWDGSVWLPTVNRPTEAFTSTTDGSGHDHTWEGKTNTRAGNNNGTHGHNAENVVAKVNKTRNFKNNSGGDTSRNGSGSPEKIHYEDDLSGAVDGEIPLSGGHVHGTLSNNESLQLSGESSTSDANARHSHRVVSDLDVSIYPSMTVRMIVFVGIE